MAVIDQTNKASHTEHDIDGLMQRDIYNSITNAFELCLLH